MSTRPYLVPQIVFNKVATNQNQYSLITNVNRISLVSYTVAWTSGVIGTITVQASNDYTEPYTLSENPLNTGNWVNIPLTVVVAPSGTADNALIALPQTSPAWVRLVFTDTSGGTNTGKLTAYISGKVA
jgi:hypothetical protein